jgi:opacity protein-like surface antigen
MKTSLAAATLACCALALPALPARADDAPKLDAFAGYSMLKFAEETRHGWEASLTWNLWGNVHALAGGVRNRASVQVLGVTISESDTNFAWAAGGGVSFRISDRWDARVQGDYFNVKIEGTNDGNPRLAAGVAYGFGRR